MKFQGKGMLLDDEGVEQVGYFKRGKLHGPGRVIFDNGDYFLG